MLRFKPRRTVINCLGDVKIWRFSFDRSEDQPDAEVVLLEDGERGEPGRAIPRDQEREYNLSTCEGVLVAMTDPRSCDVLAKAFLKAAAALRERMANLEDA